MESFLLIFMAGSLGLALRLALLDTDLKFKL